MKIYIIGSAHPLRGGGISTFNERLASALRSEGHDVTIYSFSLQYPGFLFPGKNQFTDEPAPKHIKIESVINSINPVNWLKIGNRIKREDPDLVIVRFWIPFMGACLGTIIRVIRRNKHTKVISIVDNLIPHEKRVGDKLLTKYFVRPIDGFISMSKEVLKDLKILNQPQPAVFSPHPLYDNYGERLEKTSAQELLSLPKGKRYILFFGFIRKYKGLDLLLEAMADSRLQREDIHLIVAGEYYGEEEFYTGLIDRLKLKDRVHLFTDFIPNEEVRLYFSAADCVVQPYRTATQSGISQVAFHFEKPLIVTDVGGLSEIVPDGSVGYVVSPDSRKIADAIIRFYEDNVEEKFRLNIVEEKKKYSWEVFVQSIMRLYESTEGSKK